MRKGDIRATYLGRLEDIQPFAFLVFPPWFLEKNPEAARSLRVLAPFDDTFRLARDFRRSARLSRPQATTYCPWT
ncbi:hypothetical protein MRX96_017928 [Rhipicephalus microplus]